MSNYNFQNLRLSSNNSDNKKLFITVAISMFFLTVWQIFTTPSEEELKKQQEKIKIEKVKKSDEIIDNKIDNKTNVFVNNNIKKREKKEVYLKNKNFHVGFDVANNRITFLSLNNYKQHEKSIKNVVLLDDEHFIENGWLGTYSNNDINWKLNKKGKDFISIIGEKDGLVFETIYTIGDVYDIKIKQILTNKSNKQNYIEIAPYSRASLKDTKDRIENSSAFRGILMMNDDKIKEIEYKKLQKQSTISTKSNKDGWIGVSDQYWLTGLFAFQDKENNFDKCINYVGLYSKEKQIEMGNCMLKTTYEVKYNKEKNIYQIDFYSKNSNSVVNNGKLEEREELYKLEGGSNNQAVYEMVAYVGPKKLEILNDFEKKYKFEKVDKAIDFGMFYFLSKPLLIILKRLYSITGNFGIAIILLTILVRMIIFPLANRSYRAMAKMKKIQPKMKELQEKYADDKKAFQMAIYQLYKDENINPMSSVIPLFLQIPIFFALYKVLVISIEMRDAQFFGWIVDLSSKDPSSIFNLFGLLNFDVPFALQIGVLPILMGLTMLIQQWLQPATPGMDKTQQKIMKWMPVMLTLMFASMPAGLVLYWTCSNIFTIFQQTIIIRLLNRENK